MRYASVILDIPTAALEAPYTYAVPETADERTALCAGGKRGASKRKGPVQPSLESLLEASPGQPDAPQAAALQPDPVAGVQVGCPVLVPFGGRKAAPFMAFLDGKIGAKLEAIDNRFDLKGNILNAGDRIHLTASAMQRKVDITYRFASLRCEREMPRLSYLSVRYLLLTARCYKNGTMYSGTNVTPSSTLRSAGCTT